MKIPTLAGKRIYLVELSLDFMEDMFEYSKMQEFYTYMEFEPHCSIDDTKNYLTKILKRVNKRNSVYWAICLRKTDKMIGTFGVVDIDKNHKDAQLGYGISPCYWNLGLFKESLELVIDFCYRSLGLESIRAKTMAENISSIKGLMRLGFHRESYIDKYYTKPDGTRQDAEVFCLNLNDRLHGPNKFSLAGK